MKAQQARINSRKNQPKSVPRPHVMAMVYDSIRHSIKLGMVEAAFNLCDLGPYEISRLIEDGYHIREKTLTVVVYW